MAGVVGPGYYRYGAGLGRVQVFMGAGRVSG